MLVYLQGGLGNQLFEYAFGRSLSIKKKAPVFFDKTRCIPNAVYYGIPPNVKEVMSVFIHYGLGAYDIEVNFDIPKDNPTYKERIQDFDPEVYSAPLNTAFDGIWWNEKYFNAEVIRKELSHPRGNPDEETKRTADKIASVKNSAFVSVRRGEYAYLARLLPLEYYLAGMKYIEERYSDTKFFIFSDDRDWCRQNFTASNCEVVNHSKLNDFWTLGTVHWDLWLMNMCRNAVLSNSSFSWWGAWINPNKDSVIISKLDSPNMIDYTEGMYPKEWIRI